MNRPHASKTALGLFSAVVLMLASLLLWGLHSPKIALHEDSIVFLPPMLSMATEGTFTNNIWWAARENTPDRQSVFTTHGLLYPWLIGKISGAETYEDLVISLAALRALTLILAAALIIHLRKRRVDLWSFVAVVACA